MGFEGQDEKRGFPRLPVFAGNCEITSIMGRRAPGGERSRILNWSRGGVLLRVPSPRRKFFFFAQEPVLRDQDEIRCTLRLPPQYNDIEVDAAVVRVSRAKDDPDLLEVGLRFDGATPEQKIESMARLLEPRPRSPSMRLPKQGGAEKTSERLEKAASQGADKRSRRLEKAASERLEKRASQRLEKAASERLEKKASQRAEKKTSQRIAHPGSSGRASKKSARAEEVPVEDEGRIAPRPAESVELDMAPKQSLELRKSGRQARQSGRLR